MRKKPLCAEFGFSSFTTAWPNLYDKRVWWILTFPDLLATLWHTMEGSLWKDLKADLMWGGKGGEVKRHSHEERSKKEGRRGGQSGGGSSFDHFETLSSQNSYLLLYHTYACQWVTDFGGRKGGEGDFNGYTESQIVEGGDGGGGGGNVHLL